MQKTRSHYMLGIAVTEGFSVRTVKKWSAPKRVGEGWKADEAKAGHLPAAPDLAAGDDGRLHRMSSRPFVVGRR
jgi:hypothetical protein